MREGLALSALGGLASFVLVLVLGAVVLGMGFSPSAEEREATAEARSLSLTPEDVARIYSTRCASCHGATGQGLIGPGFNNISTRLTVEEHAAVVSEGRNTMPAFAGVLRDAEIDALVAYERDILDGG